MVGPTSARLPSLCTTFWAVLVTATPVASIAAERDNSAAASAAPQLAMVAAQTADPAAPSSIPADRLEWHIPDPASARAKMVADRDKAKQEGNKATVKFTTNVLERLEEIRRSKQVHLTLEDVIRRTLANNFTIQAVSYNPAIETTRVVEAEAVFDAVVFANANRTNTDQPTSSSLASTDAEIFTMNLGIRKLLATGTEANLQYDLRRDKQSFAFQLINPAYRSSLTFNMRQPLLRGFGLDFNRSLIVIAENNRRGSDLLFRQQVRDIVRPAVELYWRLVQARRDLVVSARELADFKAIYDYLVARKEFDITPVQIDTTKADLEFARAEFIGRRAAVFDAEDQLIAMMNDPDINLVDDVELIPREFPFLGRIVVDPVAEVQTALDNRPEIKGQELAIASAKVSVGRAENAELPRFDLTFSTTIAGLAGNADRSFDKMTSGNFIDYFVGVEFEVPIGNRGPRAGRRRAELQHAQAVAQLRETFEQVILDVNRAVRLLQTNYDQIAPGFASVEARGREVRSLVARAERKDHNTLRSELAARRSLAGSRRAVLNAMVQYAIAIIDLERAKGTLLPYFGIVIPTED